MRRLDFSSPDFAATFRAFLNERRGSPADVDAAAAEVLEAVRTRGLEAVLDYTRRFDRADLMIGRQVIRRGRPPGATKTQVALRIDNEVLAAFRAGGPGWQSRMNEALRKAIGVG